MNAPSGNDGPHWRKGLPSRLVAYLERYASYSKERSSHKAQLNSEMLKEAKAIEHAARRLLEKLRYFDDHWHFAAQEAGTTKAAVEYLSSYMDRKELAGVSSYMDRKELAGARYGFSALSMQLPLLGLIARMQFVRARNPGRNGSPRNFEAKFLADIVAQAFEREGLSILAGEKSLFVETLAEVYRLSGNKADPLAWAKTNLPEK